MANRYWVGGTAVWDGTAGTKWATTSGGAGGAAVPTSADDVFFDANSTGVITVSGSKAVKNISLANFAGTLTSPTPSSNVLEIYGSIVLKAGVQNQITTAFASAIYISGVGTHTITTNGGSFGAVVILKTAAGTYTMQDDWIETQTTPSGKYLYISNGTFDCNHFNLTNQYIATGITPTIYFRDGIIKSIGDGIGIVSGVIGDMSEATFIIDCSSSLSVGFVGGGKTYKTISLTGNGTGNMVFQDSNTYQNIIDSRTEEHSIIFYTGTTQTIGNFEVNGSFGNEITIRSNTTGTHTLVNASGEDIHCNYLNIQHSIATPSNTWVAHSSTDNQSVVTAGSGWYFSPVPLWTPRTDISTPNWSPRN